MKNVIYKICEKLKGYSGDTEYFEVLQVEQNNNNDYIVIVRLVKVKSSEEAGNESNE